MALFGFGKKKETPSAEMTGQGGIPGAMDIPPGQPSAQPSGLPVDQVINFRQQGLTDNQIIQTLQRDGYDSSKIFDAMNQADMMATGADTSMSIGGNNYSEAPSAQAQPIPMQQPAYEQPMQQPAEMGVPTGAMGPQQGYGGERERIEEMAEAIIDEKWDEMIKSINKIIEWKDKTEAKIVRLEQDFKNLKSDFDNLHTAVIGKIGEYDQNIINVGTEIKAMEKVFQKILPTFTENVRELSRITRGVKATSKQPIKK
jgi:hypothetical protein